MKKPLSVARLLLLGVLLTSFVGAGAVSAAEAAQGPLPVPTGSYKVGRTLFDWTDASRADKDNRGGHRQLMVWLWYPASPKPGAEPARWMPGKWSDVYWSQSVKKLPVLAEQYRDNPVAKVRAHSYTDAPVASSAKEYPVVLFAPGAGAGPLVNTTIIEDLVSHGYVVAAIVPTYYSGFTVFSDGRVVTLNKGLPPLPTNSEKRTSEAEQEITLPDGRTVYATPEQIQKDFERTRQFPNTFLSVWTGDMKFALDQLEKLDADANSSFRGKLDLAKVGVFGHSFGGATSMQFAKDDSRVRAVIDLDGSGFGDVVKGGLIKPVLLLLHSVRNDEDIFNHAAVFQSGSPAYRVTLSNSEHFFSSDLGLMPFVPQNVKTMIVGTIDSARALTITATYVETFFGEYLQGKKSTLLNSDSREFPEVKFESNLHSKSAGTGTFKNPTAAESNSPPASSTTAADATGIWTGRLADPDAPKRDLIFTLKQDGTSITGTVGGAPPRPRDQPISNGKIEGDKLSFEIDTTDPDGKPFKSVITGKVSGNSIQGSLSSPMGKSAFELKRK